MRFVYNIPDEDDEDDDDDYEEETSQYLEIDAKTLVAHDELLKAELLRLKEQLDEFDDLETIGDKELNGLEGADLTPTAVDASVESTLNVNTKDHGSSLKSNSTGLRAQIDNLQKLMRCLDTEFAPTKQKFRDLVAKREITYDLLWCLFRQDNVVTFNDPESDLIMAGRITCTAYHEMINQKSFRITVQYIDYNGTTLHYSQRMLEIPYFQHVAKTCWLGVQLLEDDELRENLKSRAQDFLRLQGVHYLEYHDYLIVQGSFDQGLRFSATGRAMVDCASYRKMNLQGRGYQPPDGDKLSSVSGDELVLCASTVLGYSFVTKKWGRLVVDKFSPIVWR